VWSLFWVSLFLNFWHFSHFFWLFLTCKYNKQKTHWIKEVSLSYFFAIFNKCMVTGVYPNSLKVAQVIPIHKKGDKSACTNYRPISLLSQFKKIFERILHHRLYSYLQDFQLNWTSIWFSTKLVNVLRCGKYILRFTPHIWQWFVYLFFVHRPSKSFWYCKS